MSKELFIAAWEEIHDKLVEAGCPEDMATEIANERAYDRMRDRLADRADMERLRRKDETV
jgi:hypothetical protein